MISRFLNNVTDVPADADRPVLDCLTNRSNRCFASVSESSSKMIPSTPTTNLYSGIRGMLSPRPSQAVDSVVLSGVPPLLIASETIERPRRIKRGNGVLTESSITGMASLF